MAGTVNVRRWTPLGIVGGVIGIAFGRYAGIMLLIPLAVTGAAWWLYHRLLPADRRPVIPALAVQTGHIVWFALAAFLPGGLAQVAPDVIILGALTVWLGWRISRIAAVVLIVVQVASGAYNLWSLSHVSLMDDAGKALVCHILWRLLAVAALGWFLSGRGAVAQTKVAETFS
jgi:hypothetical protein